MDGKGEEEEEIKLQERNVDLRNLSVASHCQEEGLNAYLIRQVHAPQSYIGADLFVNCPGKFFIQLPRHKRHENRTERNNAGYSNAVRSDVCLHGRIDLYCWIFVDELAHRVGDLIILHTGFY